MSKKYNEIMDKVVVTDEMRRRVLKEISSADPEKRAAYKIDADDDLADVFSNRKRFPVSKILAGLAVACAIILIAGIIRLSQPVMSPSSADTMAYEEAEEFAAGDAEADTIVGNQDTGGQPSLQNSETADAGTVDAAKGEIAGGGNAGMKPETADNRNDIAAADGTDNEEAAGDVTSDLEEVTVRLSEPEIRKIVEKYMGPEFEISDTSAEDSILSYTVSDAQSKEIFSYIRIDISEGSVEIENAQTKEISTLTFREMADQ